MNRQTWLIAALGAALVLFGLSRTKQGANAVQRFTDWVLPAKGQQFATAFAVAERKYGLPRNILARIAQQESNYDPDVVGVTGDIGLMQLNPRFHPDNVARDPIASIDYAGKYLASLYKQTGTWPLALLAYNWGIGNVKAKGIGGAPAAAVKYADSIARDVGVV